MVLVLYRELDRVTAKFSDGCHWLCQCDLTQNVERMKHWPSQWHPLSKG